MGKTDSSAGSALKMRQQYTEMMWTKEAMSREELPCVSRPQVKASVHLSQGQEAGEPVVSEK